MGNVLIACEFSGVVREEFAKLGHFAMSCDLLETTQPTSKNSAHHVGDVLEVLAKTHVSWDLMIAHPPCFSGDMLVLTRTGYQEISSIKVGDEVLTHLGRWKKVTSTSNRWSPSTITLKVTGSGPIVTTNEHPFYCRNRSWPCINRKYVRVDSLIPTWKQAKDLSKGDLIGSVLPPDDNNCEYSDEHLWLMGLYVADGDLRWRVNKFEQVRFSIGKHKLERFYAKVNKKFGVNIEKSVARIAMYGKDFCATFEQFGRNCESKHLPGWVLSLTKEKATIFLNGYLFGDGHVTEQKITSSSISKKLTIAIALLLRKVCEKPSSVLLGKRAPTTIIEGRIVNQQNSWSTLCTLNPSKSCSIIDNNYTWYPYRKTVTSEGRFVYNLSVEDDESYMVDQCIVHNCTMLSYAATSSWNKPGRAELREAAMTFFMAMINANIPRICVENPVGYPNTVFRKPDQIINPYQFGHPERKRTCLWLKNLPKLIPTNIVEPEQPTFIDSTTGKKRYFTDKMFPSKDRWKLRSLTFKGIAEAFAQQYGPLLP